MLTRFQVFGSNRHAIKSKSIDSVADALSTICQQRHHRTNEAARGDMLVGANVEAN